MASGKSSMCVAALPGKALPQFDRGVLEKCLPAEGIEYQWLGFLLGGQPQEPEFYNESGYVLYWKLAESPKFRQGIQRLMAEACRGNLALLCAEKDPFVCHRHQLIARHLRKIRVPVSHFLASGSVINAEVLFREEEVGRHPKTSSTCSFRLCRTWNGYRKNRTKRRPADGSTRFRSQEREKPFGKKELGYKITFGGKGEQDKAVRIHAKRRLGERFGVSANRNVIQGVVRQIQSGTAVFACRQSVRKTCWKVLVDGKPMIAVYDKERKTVLTFLPPEDIRFKFLLPGELPVEGTTHVET
jgi:hypothetical protein